MIKPKYRKNLDAIQLARAGVEQAIGAPLTTQAKHGTRNPDHKKQSKPKH